jgi:hypothetical protein
VNHHALASFWRHYELLPEAAQRLADKNFELLKADRNHPSIRFKPVGELWSARVGAHYRALARIRGDHAYWIWIGHHTEYDRIVG